MSGFFREKERRAISENEREREIIIPLREGTGRKSAGSTKPGDTSVLSVQLIIPNKREIRTNRTFRGSIEKGKVPMLDTRC